MQEKGFLGSLFDISFRSFVATKIVSVLFVIALMLSALYTLFAIAAARIYENTSILAAHASPTLQPPSAPGRQPSSGAQSPSE